MTKRRVVVTGLGIISPVGNDVPTAWNNVVAGRSGIGPIENFDASAFSTTFAGCIKNFDVTEYMPAKDARKVDEFVHYGFAAAEQEPDDQQARVVPGKACGRREGRPPDDDPREKRSRTKAVGEPSAGNLEQYVPENEDAEDLAHLCLAQA